MTTHGTTAHATEAALDLLYSWRPPATPPAPPLPAAAFSLTLKGTLDGVEARLTVRGQTPEEFKRHRQAIRGLLDTPAQPQASGEGWGCKHGVQMKRTEQDGRSWWSHRTDQGWCQGK